MTQAQKDEIDRSKQIDQASREHFDQDAEKVKLLLLGASRESASRDTTVRLPSPTPSLPQYCTPTRADQHDLDGLPRQRQHRWAHALAHVRG
jgi:hypothetical protein